MAQQSTPGKGLGTAHPVPYSPDEPEKKVEEKPKEEAPAKEEKAPAKKKAASKKKAKK